MSATRLQINSVYRFDPHTDAHRDERILWIDDAASTAAMIDVLSPKAKLHFIDCSALDERLEDESLVEIDDPYSHLMLTDDVYSETRLKERDDNTAAMAVLTDALPEVLFDRPQRGKLVKQIASRDKSDPLYLNPKTVHVLLRRYWQRGQMPNAFLTDRHLCGWHNEKRECSLPNQKQGRKCPGEKKGVPSPGFVRTKKSDEILCRIGKLYWRTRAKNGKRRNWKQALQLGLERFFQKGWKLVNGVRVPILPPANELPTVSQLKRTYYKHANIEEIARKREGERKFNLKFRPLRGDQRQLSWGPMHLVQMDSQQLKIYIVDDVTREVICRPTLTMGRDTMSRLIAGFSLTRGSERAMEYKLAIANMAEDKVEYCRRLGIDILPGEWPCRNPPNGCLVDNGPGISSSFNDLRKGLKMRVFNTGGGRPDMKPIIESGFKDLNENLIFTLPGTVLTESTDPDSDPETKRYIEQACLDMGELERAIVYYILDYNRRVLQDYPLTDAMKGVVNPIPIDLWNWGIRNCTGTLRTVPIGLVRLHCLSKGTARVTPKGIIFEGKPYDSDSAIKGGWQTKARLDGTWKIDILYDERNLGTIYLRHDKDKSCPEDPYYEPCWRICTKGERTDYSLDDLRRERAASRIRIEQLTQARPQQAAEFNAKVSALTEQAASKTTSVLKHKKQTREGMLERRQAAIREEWRNVKPLGGGPRIHAVPSANLDPGVKEEGDELPAEASSDYALIIENFQAVVTPSTGETHEG